MPYLYQASDLDLHSRKGQDYHILSCWPNIKARLLETQPGESCRINSLVQEEDSCLSANTALVSS